MLQLPQLLDLSLSRNDLTGTIAAGWGKLTNVEVHYNQLVGSLPESLFTEQSLIIESDASPLWRFNVGGNNLEGEIPTTIGMATKLAGLFLFENNFVGTLPLQLGNLRDLQSFRAQRNLLTGPLPISATNVDWFISLSELWLYNNVLDGSIPPIIGNFLLLSDLRLSGNRLSSVIPENVYNLSRIRHLALDRNLLEGTISPRVNLMTDLSIFDVADNALYGPVPSGLAELRNLQRIEVEKNMFSGPIPLEFCDDFALPLLTVLRADCLPTINPPNPCECCTGCCNRDTKVCTDDEEPGVAEVRAQVLAMYGSDIDLSDGSPHDRTIRWIADDDEMNVHVTDPSFWQRYILALFWYQTGPWRSCNPDFNDLSLSFCMYERFERQEDDSIIFVPVPATRWLSSTSECAWAQVLCDFNGRLIGIFLSKYCISPKFILYVGKSNV